MIKSDDLRRMEITAILEQKLEKLGQNVCISRRDAHWLVWALSELEAPLPVALESVCNGGDYVTAAEGKRVSVILERDAQCDGPLLRLTKDFIELGCSTDEAHERIIIPMAHVVFMRTVNHE